MHSKPRLDRPTPAALLSLLVVCISCLALTFAAPRARGVLLFFAFPLWTIGLRPADRMMSFLHPISPDTKPRKIPRELEDLA